MIQNKTQVQTVSFRLYFKVIFRQNETRLSKMHAEKPICFNFFNFHPVSTKFPMNIEHVILTNRMFFVFGIAKFWAGNDVTNLKLKN
jgi:hypothetical protein